MESIRKLYKIGPGPSSSHTMGPEKAAKYTLKKYPEANRFCVTLYGSLALTGKGHLTDYILKKTLGEERTEVIFDFLTEKSHPNTLIIDAYKDVSLLKSQEFVSIGGGTIYITGVDSDIIDNKYPFKNFEEIKEYSKKEKTSLPEIVLKFEGKDIEKYLDKVYEAMNSAIERGLTKDGILPGGLSVKRKASSLFQADKDETEEEKDIRIIMSYAYAVSEENASAGRVVTAPTCGSSGVLPACLFFFKDKMNLKKEKIIEALSVAGLIGNVVRTNASISGACAGCQSEIGTACSMAASAVSYLKGGDIEEIECAAEIAMEHHLGLTCDPAKGLVQIPCIERNAVAALRAIDASFLSHKICPYKKVSFDKVVQTMFETGKDLNAAYRETSMGGLAKHILD